MIDIVTISSKGQLVIPRGVREEMGIELSDKLMLVYDSKSILLRKISKEDAKKDILGLMDKASGKFASAKMKQTDIQKEINRARMHG
jgi:AbrB family looped-hinge helix DNA binding protein